MHSEGLHWGPRILWLFLGSRLLTRGGVGDREDGMGMRMIEVRMAWKSWCWMGQGWGGCRGPGWTQFPLESGTAEGLEA